MRTFTTLVGRVPTYRYVHLIDADFELSRGPEGELACAPQTSGQLAALRIFRQSSHVLYRHP